MVAAATHALNEGSSLRVAAVSKHHVDCKAFDTFDVHGVR
jgi:hypothetical protein